MTDELTNENGRVEDMTQDYLAAIKELKENSVDRSQYEKLRADNKKLLDAVVNGQGIETEAPAKETSIDELRKELFTNENLGNLEYVSKALELREALIKKGEPDPFLPYGKQIMPTDEDISTANRVAAVLQECVDYAEGDSAIFTNELQRRTVDVKVR